MAKVMDAINAFAPQATQFFKSEVKNGSAAVPPVRAESSTTKADEKPKMSLTKKVLLGTGAALAAWMIYKKIM